MKDKIVFRCLNCHHSMVYLGKALEHQLQNPMHIIVIQEMDNDS